MFHQTVCSGTSAEMRKFLNQNPHHKKPQYLLMSACKGIDTALHFRSEAISASVCRQVRVQVSPEASKAGNILEFLDICMRPDDVTLWMVPRRFAICLVKGNKCEHKNELYGNTGVQYTYLHSVIQALFGAFNCINYRDQYTYTKVSTRNAVFKFPEQENFGNPSPTLGANWLLLATNFIHVKYVYVLLTIVICIIIYLLA